MKSVRRKVYCTLTILSLLLLSACTFNTEGSNVSVETKTESVKEETVTEPVATEASEAVYSFRSDKHLTDHYNKHGIDMGFASKEEYEEAANKVINDPASLHKTEKEDGDDVYYLEETNEFVVVSTDGYIRTYFCPDSGKKYFDKQ